MQKIVIDEMSRVDSKHPYIEQAIYVNCECKSLDHIGRFIVMKSTGSVSGDEYVEVFYEINGSLYIAPNRASTNGFIYWFQHTWAKIQKAIEILFCKNVYFGVDFFIDGDTGKKLAEALGVTIDRITDTPVRLEDVEVNDEEKDGVCSEQ